MEDPARPWDGRRLQKRLITYYPTLRQLVLRRRLEPKLDAALYGIHHQSAFALVRQSLRQPAGGPFARIRRSRLPDGVQVRLGRPTRRIAYTREIEFRVEQHIRVSASSPTGGLGTLN